MNKMLKTETKFERGKAAICIFNIPLTTSVIGWAGEAHVPCSAWAMH